MQKLREIIARTEADKKAVGHFNISDIIALWGIFNAARALNLPVIIGTSEGERAFIGVPQTVALIRSIREEFNYPIFLNADHTYSFEGVKKAADAGYDAVIFDGAELSLEENIKITRECVEYAKSINPDIIVEGELGYIGKSSKMLDEAPELELTTPEQAKEYVEKTGIDLLAPAVGNLHGMLKGRKNPNLDINRIKEIRQAAGVPLVLHGGSGITDADFVSAIKAGISTIHINTEIRVAWRDSIKKFLEENPDAIAPYKIGRDAVSAVQKTVGGRLQLFNS